MERDRVSLQELQLASNALGKKRTEKSLEILSENEVFIAAWRTNVGQELLGYLVDRYGTILGMLAIEADADKCITLRAELKTIVSLVNHIASKVNAYVGTVNRIREKANTSREVRNG
jgi:hypothetical protein